MPQYVIEREIPGAGDLTADDLKGISQKSCGILKDMATGIEWDHSYVTGDKVYCVYNADNDEINNVIKKITSILFLNFSIN